MSRHHLARENDPTTDEKAQAAQRSPELPAAAMVRQMLARGNPDPHAIAEIVNAHPASRNEVFALLHQTLGNAFARHVSELCAATGGLGETRDVKTFDVSSEYQESRATIDGPPKESAQSTSGEYQESRATIDGPPKESAPSTSSEYQESRATIDHPHRETAPDTSGEYQESRATIDHPHAEKPAAPWVVRARRFNRAHADNVRAFLDSTGTSCVDEAGEPDPQKVARWQADHGLPPDGRIGDQTVRAAVTDPSMAL